MLLYPDTNIFLHYRRLDEIDWRTIVNAEELTIVVMQVVVRELERHKHQHPVKRIRRRADAIVSFLHGQLSQGMQDGLPVSIREGVSLDFQRGEPQIDFANAGLVETVQDDHIVASVLALRVEGAAPDARIVTADVGLRVKAYEHSIPIVELPDDLKIVDGPDPQDREIADLRKQLAHYEQAAPQVGLAFEDGQNHWKFSPATTTVLAEDARQEALARVREEHPKMALGGDRQPSDRLPGGLDLAQTHRLVGRTGPSDAEVESYNEKLDEFYAAYLKHLEAMNKHRAIVARAVPLVLWLDNGGTAPADDLDVFLQFPPGVIVLDAEHFPSEPRPPTPPERPRARSILDAFGRTDLAALTRLHTPYVPDLSPVFPNESSPTIEDGKSFRVSYHVRRLKHNLRERLDELRVIFSPDAEVRSFPIGVHIHVGNFPDEIAGKLHVVIAEQDELDEGSG